tara:strand:+ start:96 stop:443 length:348 start_codon:yes stop_codon:yes gene_type:complete
MTDNEYAKCVDRLVSTMRHTSPTNSQQPMKPQQPFDTEAYANYKALVDKEREQIDVNNLTESIYKLGYKIDNILSKLISQLDTITNDEFNPDKVTCSVDDKEVDCDTWEEDDLHA